MMTKREITLKYWAILLAYFPFWVASEHTFLKSYVFSSLKMMEELHYITREEAEATPYVLKAKLELLAEILGKDYEADLQLYNRHPLKYS